MKHGLLNFLQHPIRSYVNSIKHSILPKPYSHQVKMNVLIKKGQKSGTALIPCSIYAMDHSIDLNPALIRKKDKKPLVYINPKDKVTFVEDESIDTYEIEKKKIRYNPNNIVVTLTDDEQKKGYELQQVKLEEYERCTRCGQKVVLAEVAQTRYRSCPEIHVKLADPAKADTTVPVEFGVNKADIITWPMVAVFGILSIVWITIAMMWPNWAIGLLGTGSGPLINTPLWVGNAMRAVLIIFLWVFLVPRLIYKPITLIRWYKSVKKDMKVSKYAYY
jgi:ribosomal protein S27AE